MQMHAGSDSSNPESSSQSTSESGQVALHTSATAAKLVEFRKSRLSHPDNKNEQGANKAKVSTHLETDNNRERYIINRILMHLQCTGPKPAPVSACCCILLHSLCSCHDIMGGSVCAVLQATN